MKNQVELEAIDFHPYGTGFREVGEKYFASPEDAKLLVSLGRAKVVEKLTDDKTEDRTLKAEEPSPEQESAKDGPRAYNRRDMKAKG